MSPRRIGPGTVALVSGAAGSIGSAVARALASRGAKVVCADIDLSGASATAHAVNGLAAGLDVSDPAMWENALDVTTSAYGPPNLMVSCAGVVSSAWALDPSAEDISGMVKANVLGTIHGLRAALARFQKSGGGRIVTIGSMASYLPMPGQAVYAATQHAVRAYHLGVAGELTSGPVRFTLVSAGIVASDRLEHERDNPAAAASFAHRPVSPEEVAAAMIWASDRNMPEICVPSRDSLRTRILGAFPGRARAFAHHLRVTGKARIGHKP